MEELPGVPEALETLLKPSTIRTLELIADASGVSAETVAAGVLDLFADHYRDMVLNANLHLTDERIDEAADMVDPTDP